MKFRDWLRTERLQYVTLWALAVICVGSALANIDLLGFDPFMLAVLATVFAASTTTYKQKSHCRAG
jgi:hypothetical protein